MENFTHRKKEIKFWRVTGEVLGSNKYSETHVSSSGGGGYVGGYASQDGGYVGGHVSAPTIHSKTVTNHEFWIKTENGQEKDVSLTGVNIPLRPGQKISLIYAGEKGSTYGWHCLLVNHSANKYWFLRTMGALNGKFKLEQFSGKSLLIAGAIAWSILYFTAPARYDGRDWSDASWAIAIGVATIFIIFRFILKFIKILNLHTKLKSHLEALAQFALKNYGS